MNLNEIQSVWNSPVNIPRNSGMELLARQFSNQMVRRHRFQSVWHIFTFVWLTLISVLVLGNLATGNLNPAVEWAVFPLLTVTWAFAIHFLRRYLKRAAPIAHDGGNVAESFRAALISTLREKDQLKLVAILLVILIPFLVVTVQQLQAAGKVSSRELVSMGVFFSGVLLLNFMGLALRYFWRLLPQQRKLESLLGELDETTEGSALE